MKFFNALQIVTLFSAWPMLINWLGNNPFKGAEILYYVAWVVYVVGFFFLTFSVAEAIEKT
jgi:hypothetical protein